MPYFYINLQGKVARDHDSGTDKHLWRKAYKNYFRTAYDAAMSLLKVP